MWNYIYNPCLGLLLKFCSTRFLPRIWTFKLPGSASKVQVMLYDFSLDSPPPPFWGFIIAQECTGALSYLLDLETLPTPQKKSVNAITDRVRLLFDSVVQCAAITAEKQRKKKQ